MNNIIVKDNEALTIRMWRDRHGCESKAVLTLTVTNEEQDIESITTLLEYLPDIVADNSVNIHSICVQKENGQKKDLSEELAAYYVSCRDFEEDANHHDYILNSEAYEEFLHRDPFYNENDEHRLTAIDLGLGSYFRSY